MFSIYAGTTPTKALEVVQLIRENLENIKSHGLTQEEIARAKGQAKGALVLGMEDTGSRMSRLGKSELMYGNQKSVDELLEEIDAVSSESIKALSSQLLSNKMSMTIIGPFSGKNQGQFDRALA
jgi:predicted Zn-dependent peptidase